MAFKQVLVDRLVMPFHLAVDCVEIMNEFGNDIRHADVERVELFGEMPRFLEICSIMIGKFRFFSKCYEVILKTVFQIAFNIDE